MFAEHSPVPLLVTALLVALAMVVLYRLLFSRENRERRRRNKSYGRVVSRREHSATVNLSVKTPQEKRPDRN
jgi:hypothetical protein